MNPVQKHEPKVKVAAKAVDVTPIAALLLISVVIVLLSGTLSGM